MTHAGNILYTTVSSKDDDSDDLESFDDYHAITIEQLHLDFFAAITEKASKSVIQTSNTQVQELTMKSKAEKQEVGGSVDLAVAGAKRRFSCSSFQLLERRQSRVRIAELEAREQVAAAKEENEQRQSKVYSDALRDFSKSEEMELHRLWTEVSEAGKRIAKLEEEQTFLDDKLQSVEEDRNRLFAKRKWYFVA